MLFYHLLTSWYTASSLVTSWASNLMLLLQHRYAKQCYPQGGDVFFDSDSSEKKGDAFSNTFHTCNNDKP